MLLNNHNTVKIYPREVIIAYVQQYITDDYEEKTNDKGHWINIPSPFYIDGRKRLGFNYDTGIVFDFKLQRAWDLEKFVMEERDVPRAKAEKILFEIRYALKKQGIVIRPPTRQTIEEENAKNLDLLQEPAGLKSFNQERIMRNKMGRKGLIYLQGREFTSEIIDRFGLKYIDHEVCPQCNGDRFINGDKCSYCNGWGKNKFHGRIYVPTYENGKLVYFQARDYMGRDKKWKYMNPSVSRSQVVYFYDLLKANDRVFIAEGPFDAMYLSKGNSVTALMGNKMSKAFAQKLLWKTPKQVIFIPDFDKDLKTRKGIFKNLTYNINKIIGEANYPIEVGVYNWFALTDAKDINAGGINYVDESLLIFPKKEPTKFRNMIHEILYK